MKPEVAETAEGALRSARFTTEAYRLTEQAYILELRQPVCLEGTDEYDKVESTRKIHVYSIDKAMLKRLRGMVGKTVKVVGYAVGETNVHHHAPIVMSIDKIDPL